jgi:hypothetical protein
VDEEVSWADDLLYQRSKKLSPNFPFAIIDDERRRTRLRRGVMVIAATPRGGSLREGLTSPRGVDDGIFGWVPGSRFWQWYKYCKIVEENVMNFPDGCARS